MESTSGGAVPASASSPEARNMEAPPASSPVVAAQQAEGSSQPPSRYESQKRRDWNTFLQYLRNHKPPLTLARCSGAHVIEFLKYLDQFGKTKVHVTGCPHFGHPNPPSPCVCPLRQAWGSLDALIGRLRAAYEENGGRPESNPFGARAVRIYLREVREGQAKARGIPYEKKKRKRTTMVSAVSGSGAAAASGSGGNGAGDDTSAGAGVASVSTAPPSVTTTSTTG
ncbi:hypothetical protein TanjilG_32577 [Lupinus angustifolius]|uniref:ALOG domain-containing protein n=1 Tax=Lupinus angustifolius TaxID=3871 RepID=A0A4P1R8G2_LUPAN|nr:PREDICTED: protein LIGHT-DEPENDENT SHORT HYPOCOTYLS 5-like [Lupinus angustifolius]OIW04385.1 hypothetical protein TanjilG_32577 [Lupinus angustifolius]